MLTVLAPSLLCVWNWIFWRNLRTVVIPHNFFSYSFVDSMNSKHFKVVDWFVQKPSWFFQRIFCFRSDIFEKQRIINLSSYSSKSYASVVLNGYEVTFLEEMKDATFHPFPHCFVYRLHGIGGEVSWKIFSSSIRQGVCHQVLHLFYS